MAINRERISKTSDNPIIEDNFLLFQHIDEGLFLF